MARAVILLAFVVSLLPAGVSAQAGCEFKLGFKALRDQIPGMVGGCLENEWHNTANGNTEQRTSAHHGQGGLLVWRKADNWTAFTDGHWTWVNGPFGVQRRLNAGPLFAWEAPAAAQENAAPGIQGGGQWAMHDDPEKSFKYPAGWRPLTRGAFNYYVAPDETAYIIYMAPFRYGAAAKVADHMGRLHSSNAAGTLFEIGQQSDETINGFPAELQWFATRNQPRRQGIAAGFQRGGSIFYLEGSSVASRWSSFEPVLLEVIRSYTPKSG